MGPTLRAERRPRGAANAGRRPRNPGGTAAAPGHPTARCFGAGALTPAADLEQTVLAVCAPAGADGHGACLGEPREASLRSDAGVTRFMRQCLGLAAPMPSRPKRGHGP